MPDIETPIVTDKLLTEFICRYGLPLQIHTDQGAQFTSDLFVELCKRLSICNTRNNPFHPHSAGLVERLNRTIEDMLSKFVSKHQKDCNKFLPFLMMAYRSSVDETLGEIPCFMMVGREATLTVDLIYGRYKTQENDSIPEYVETLMNRLEVVRGKLVSASERQKRHYDLSCTFPRFTVGDGVLLQDTKKYKGLSKKFQFRWIDPFTFPHVISDVLYKIQEKPKTKPKVIHVNRLKPYQGNMKRWYQPPGEPALNNRGRCLNNTQ